MSRGVSRRCTKAGGVNRGSSDGRILAFSTSVGYVSMLGITMGGREWTHISYVVRPEGHGYGCNALTEEAARY